MSSETDLAGELRDRTERLLDVLDEGQRGKVRLPFDEGRRTWTYLPAARTGLALHELDRTATKAVMRLLATAMPVPAFVRAITIMGLDEVLDRSEGWSSGRRHRDAFWVAVYGRPGDPSWAWRFEGHHVSVNATVTGDRVDVTPLFLGANPAVVLEAGRPVVAPLAVEEALGFELLHALTVEQRTDAVVSETAPDDILTRDDPRVDTSLAGSGIPLAALSGGAASAAGALLDVYLGRFPSGARRPDPHDARFAWAGAAEPGIGHYYRVAAPRLLVELDNTQDGANHVHTVVRDPAGDFGGDALGDHHRHAHG